MRAGSASERSTAEKALKPLIKAGTVDSLPKVAKAWMT